jgi:hypothetical protein
MVSWPLLVLNLALLVGVVLVVRRPGLLGYARDGRWYLTWLSIGVITFMDESTSIFYAPAEAHRFIGEQAIFFIAATSLLMRVLSSRMVEIAQILELHGIRGGGVYSFSYLVLGPAASFVAVASIMVDYILTACISTVSAVINGTTFLPLGPGTEGVLVIGIIWAVAGLNIVGIRENARVTFGIFIATAVVFLNLIALGFLHMDPASPGIMAGSASGVFRAIGHHGLPNAIAVITIGVASCLLAYSGIESVLQTAGLVSSWRDISKAYWFLALTVGVATPVISALALSAPIDVAQHEGDLIPTWAATVGNEPFAVLVGLLGSVILIMAMNTAYVASSELLERVGHRYRFHWLLATNRRDSLYRIHMLNAVLYTGIILLTRGSQAILAEMYAIGLLASFIINVGCLLIYRFFMGTKEIRGGYVTSRAGTLALEALLVACFVYLALHKPYGTGLWAAVVALLLAAGIPFSRRYGPEVQEVRRSDYPLDMVLALSEVDEPVEIHLRRPGEPGTVVAQPGSVFVTFFSPRQPIPERWGSNHYRFAIQGGGLYRSITALLALVQEELGGRPVVIHLGWPTSSWLDRMATGIFVWNVLRLPRAFPKLSFKIEHLPSRQRDMPIPAHVRASAPAG